MQPSELRVVTTARWLADDLALGSPVPVVHDIGLDVASDTTATAWWMPHTYYARLAATSGVALPRLTSLGPTWLASVPRELTRRAIAAVRLSDAATSSLWHSGPAFAKPAEIKVSRLPAQMWTSAEEFTEAAALAGLQPTSWVLLSQPITFRAEYRCFIAPAPHGGPDVVAASAYLVDGVTWDAWQPADAPDTTAAEQFARTVAERTPAPRAYVLDVGETDQGWAVVEANAAWSSSPYHADPAGVVHALLTAQDGRDDPRWTWRSDPLLEQRARPLPIRHPFPER